MTGARVLVRVVMGLCGLALTCVSWVTLGTAVRSAATVDAQRSADAAALAGAGTLLASPRDPGPARAEAIRFARMNPVLGRTPELRAGDVAVDVDSGSVRITVRAKIYSVPNVLAWILGVGRLDVSAVAAAEARAGDPLARPPVMVKTLKLIDPRGPHAADTERESR